TPDSAPLTLGDSAHAPKTDKGKSVLPPTTPASGASGSTSSSGIPPITKPAEPPRTKIDRSSRFRISVPAAAFGDKTKQEYENIVYKLFIHFCSLTDLRVYS